MTAHSLWTHLEPGDVARTLRQTAVEQLNRGEGEVLLDFSSIIRIDGADARAMEEFADRADAAAVKVVFRSVRPGVYKVLKLLRLSQRFSYVP